MCVCVRGAGGGERERTFDKVGHLGEGGVPNFLLGRGDKREKGRLM